MDRSRVAIVIPAYNESSTVARVVRDVAQYGTPIVVDDASYDQTGTASAAAGAIVLRNEVNAGYDGALDAGFRRAAELDMEFVVTIDADGQHVAESLREVLAELERGADVVIGIRPRKARFAEWLFSTLTRRRYGIRDPLCGMKGYRLSVYREQGHFDSRESVGTELMLFAARRGKVLAQVPIPVRERNGKARFGSGIRGNLKILRAIYRTMFA